MKQLARTLRVAFLYFRINLSSAMAYRSAFFMQSVSMLISNASFIFFWWIAFGVFGGRIGGYAFDDVMFIWSVTSAAFGVASVFFGNFSGISGTIISGELDVYLLQPKPVLLGLLCNRMSFAGWGDLIYGILLMAITRGGDPSAWLVFIPSILVGGALFAAVSLTAHSLTFFFGDASLVGGAALEFLINFSLYPMGIFPSFIRLLMRTIIPAALIAHLPLELLHGFSWGTLGALALGVSAYGFIAYRFFRFGLKRYESGNLIITRM